MSSTLPLFSKYPELATALPHLSLCELPTPVNEQVVAGISTLIKRDDLTAVKYAGNKVRKLEFALGEAKQRGCKEIITFGFAGSNSATACAIHAQANGMRSISMLLPQPPEPYVAENLRQSLLAGAELHECSNTKLLTLATLWQIARHTLKTGKRPMIVPAGVSSTLGVIAYVNAGFELAEQIRRGELREPDCVYAAMGTAGTAAGLWLGLHAAGLNCKVVAVRVVDKEYCNRAVLEKLAKSVAKKLSKYSAFPSSLPPAELLQVVDEQFGDGYGVPTPETRAAIEAARVAGIELDVTYTGKAYAQLLADSAAGRTQRPLFWLTKNARSVPAEALALPVDDFPRRLRRYL